MSKQTGTKGMGSHKHAISGHATRSPSYKMQRTREDNVEKQQLEEKKKKVKSTMFGSFKELFKK